MRISAINKVSFGQVITTPSGEEYLKKKLGKEGAQKFKYAQKNNSVADIKIDNESVYVRYYDKKGPVIVKVKSHLIDNRADEIIYKDNRGRVMDAGWVFDGEKFFNVAPLHYSAVSQFKSCEYKAAPIKLYGKRGIFVSQTIEYPRNYGQGNEVFTNADLIATELKNVDPIERYRRFVVENNTFCSNGSSIGGRKIIL